MRVPSQEQTAISRRSNVRFSYVAIVGGLLTTQFILGCQPAVEEDNTGVPGVVNVPSSMDRPSELVGKWQESKGKQSIELSADGSCQMLNTISMGAPGATTSSKITISCKWGTKDGKFYFAEMKDSPPLSYDWESKNGKLLLSNNGSKLTYTQAINKEEKK